MEYWEWKSASDNAVGAQDHVFILAQKGVAIYNQETLTEWTRGTLTLTSHELIYTAEDDPSAHHKTTTTKKNAQSNVNSNKSSTCNASNAMSISLSLELISSTSQLPMCVKGSLFKSEKIIISLPAGKYVKLSFRDGGIKVFYDNLMNALNRKTWQTQRTSSQTNASSSQSHITTATITSTQEHTKDNTNNTNNNTRVKTGGNEYANMSKTVTSNNFASSNLSSHVGTSNVTFNDEKNRVAPAASMNEGQRELHYQKEYEQRPMLGIAGVMYAAQQNAQLTDTLASIDDVMSKASAIVNSIRLLKQKQQANASGSNDNESEADKLALESIEETLGLGTLVTRSDKSKYSYAAATSTSTTHDHSVHKYSSFHVQLASELHGWMTHARNAQLFAEMAIIPLIELFALYNKARSGDLVSPDDVLTACKVISGRANSLFTLQTLASGRKALVHKDNSFMLLKLTSVLGPQFAKENNSVKSSNTKSNTSQNRVNAPSCIVNKSIPITSTLPRSESDLKGVNEVQAANLFRVAIPVARDVLYKLEDDGYLCRSDGGFGCITFYWNIFVL